MDPTLVVAGEVGLAGEVRAVQQTDKRLKEAERLGFERAITARTLGGRAALKTTLKLEPVAALREAISLALVDELIRSPLSDHEDEQMEEPFEN